MTEATDSSCGSGSNVATNWSSSWIVVFAHATLTDATIATIASTTSSPTTAFLHHGFAVDFGFVFLDAGWAASCRRNSSFSAESRQILEIDEFNLRRYESSSDGVSDPGLPGVARSRRCSCGDLLHVRAYRWPAADGRVD